MFCSGLARLNSMDNLKVLLQALMLLLMKLPMMKKRFLDREGEPEDYDWLEALAEAANGALAVEHDRARSSVSSSNSSSIPKEPAVKRLKLWALSAPAHATRLLHQGRRGCAALSEADAALTDADLEQRLLTLPTL